MGGANSVDRPGTHLNQQANVHSDPIVRSSKSSLSGEVVAEEANTRVKEVSSAPNKDVNARVMATTAANSESEQGDYLHQRAVRYSTSSSVHGLSVGLFVTSRCSIKTAKRKTRKERRSRADAF